MHFYNMVKKTKPTEYRLSILREEEKDRFYPEDDYRERVMGIRPKRWNEYVSFDLNHEEVIELLAVITRMRGMDRNHGRN